MKFKGRVKKEGQNRRPRQAVTSLESQDINMKSMEKLSVGVDSWENVANLSYLNRLEEWLGPAIRWQEAGKESRVKEFM